MEEQFYINSQKGGDSRKNLKGPLFVNKTLLQLSSQKYQKLNKVDTSDMNVFI